MVKLVFVQPDGSEKTLEADAGSTAMHAAVKHLVDGIEAECGGALACATCHVYVDEAWLVKTGKMSPMEEDMLDFAQDMRPNSRLSCQIRLSEELDGLKLYVPESQ